MKRLLVALAILWPLGAAAQPVPVMWRPPTTCSTGTYLKWNGSAWACSAVLSESSAAGTVELYGSGAGQTTPTFILDAGSRSGLMVVEDGGTSTDGGGVCFGNGSSRTAGSLGWACIKGSLSNTSGNTIGELGFYTRNSMSDVSLLKRMDIGPSGTVTMQQGLYVAGYSQLISGFQSGADSDMTSHKITSLASGVAASDAANVGQINGSVSGTTNTTAKFTGLHAVGNGWALDDGTTWGVSSKFAITEATGNTLVSGTLGVGSTTAAIFPMELFNSSAGQATTALTDAGSRNGLAFVGDGGSSVGNGGGVCFGNTQSHAANSLGWACVKGALGDGSGNTRGSLAISTRSATGDTSLQERFRVTSSGQIFMGDSTNTSIDDNANVLTIGNTGTSQTTSSNVVTLTNSATYDATASALSATGLNIQMTATRASGANTFQNFAATLSASGATTSNVALRTNLGENWFNVSGGVSGFGYPAASTLPSQVSVKSTSATVGGVDILRTTAAATSSTPAMSIQENGSYDTSGGVVTARGETIIMSSTKSAGAPLLTNRALFLGSSGADNNYSLVVDTGDNYIDATSGNTAFGIAAGTALNAKVRIDGEANASVLTVNSNRGNQTVDGRILGLFQNLGSYDTTATGITAQGINVLMTSTRSLGANPLVNTAATLSASGAQSNRALITNDGGVTLNAVSGTTSIGFSQATSSALTVSGTTAVTSTNTALNAFTATANSAAGTTSTTALRGTNTSTYDATGTALEVYAMRGINTASRSAGTFSVTSVGVDGEGSGGQSNYGLIGRTTGTGTTNAGLLATATGAGTTNIGGDFTATSAGTNIGIRTTDGTNYLNTASGSSGFGYASGAALPSRVSVSIAAGAAFAQATPNDLGLTDSTSAAQGVGGFQTFYGAYTGTTTTIAGAIKAMKSNGTTGDYDFDLAFGTRRNGNTDITKRLVIDATGATNMLGQGVGVGGIHASYLSPDVADVLYSGLNRKNLSKFSRAVGDDTAADGRWRHQNGTATLAYTTSSQVSPYGITENVGQITCTGATCTSNGADYRYIATSATHAISDVRSRTFTLSVWVKSSSGTNANFTLQLGRYNDADLGIATCAVNSTTWTRCSLTRTFGATSQTDNSELRAYLLPESTTAHYISGAQIELGSDPTPVEDTDSTLTSGAYAQRGGAGAAAYSTGSGPDNAYGVWANSLNVGNVPSNPYMMLGPNGDLAARSVTTGLRQETGITGDQTGGYFYSNATADATAAVRTITMVSGIANASRSAGGNNVKDIGGEFDAQNGQVNIALQTDHANNYFNTVSGNTCIGIASGGTCAATLTITGSETVSTTLDVTGALNGYTQITKSADQDVTNSTTLTDDTGLTFSVTAGKIYAIDAFFIYGGSDTTGDATSAWTVAAGTMDCTGTDISVTTADAIQTVTMIATAAASTNTVSIGTRADASLPIAVRETMACKVSNTTTLKHQFAEASAVSAKVARVMAGSIVKYKQLN